MGVHSKVDKGSLVRTGGRERNANTGGGLDDAGSCFDEMAL